MLKLNFVIVMFYSFINKLIFTMLITGFRFWRDRIISGTIMKCLIMLVKSKKLILFSASYPQKFSTFNILFFER